MKLQTLLLSLSILGICGLLTACGFTLRGYGESVELPEALQTLTVTANNPGNEMLRELESSLRASGVTLSDSVTEGQHEIILGDERSRERIISLDSSARAGEYAIDMTVSFQLREGNRTVLGPEDISLEQTYLADQNNAIAKDEEARIIRSEMRRQIASQIIARLQAFSPTAPGSE